jgi:hypothetical protein
MAKNLRHLLSVEEAAQQLHRLLFGSPWYVRCQVFTVPAVRATVVSKEEKKEIVVYVRDLAAAGGPSVYNSWPIRYEKV